MSILGCGYFARNVTGFTFINQICWSLQCEYTQPYSNTLFMNTSLPSPPTHDTMHTVFGSTTLSFCFSRPSFSSSSSCDWCPPSRNCTEVSSSSGYSTPWYDVKMMSCSGGMFLVMSKWCHVLVGWEIYFLVMSKWCRVLVGWEKYFVVMSKWCRVFVGLLLWWCHLVIMYTVVRERSILHCASDFSLLEETVWYESGTRLDISGHVLL